MAELTLDLFDRVSERAHDPARRTYMAGARAKAQPLDLGSLLSSFQLHGAPGAQGLLSGLGNLQKLNASLAGLGGLAMLGPGGMTNLGGGAPANPQDLAEAPSDEQIMEAENRIGRALPPEVLQLYAIGDGGFGPGEGLFPIAELARRYHELTREPYGPKGQDWPRNLLPLFEEDPVLLCIDMDSGAITAWDPEEIEDEESDEDWQRSFKPEAPSLAALLESWLARPTFHEEHGRAAS